LRRQHVHRIPLPTLVTIAKRPSGGGGTRADNHIFPKNGSEIFRVIRLTVAMRLIRLANFIVPRRVFPRA
jgi:hypothetical protein